MTIKNTIELLQLANKLRLTRAQLINQLIDNLEKHSLVDLPDAGENLLVMLEHYGYNHKAALELLFTPQQIKQHRAFIVQALATLVIWGEAKENPCPDCGSETQRDEDDIECTNCTWQWHVEN